MTTWHKLGVLLLILLCGCSGVSTGSTAGTEALAREHFDAEFKKWMAGQENEVATMKSRLETLLAPISYDVRSVVPDKPDMVAVAADYSKNGSPTEVSGEWTAWRFNVAIEWKSKAGTPVEKVATYTLTWNPREQKWYVTERK